ncbi:MAG: methyltransferase family protein [Burkholderiales bacterium]
MKSLELKLPPPVILAIIAALMWAVAPAGPSLGLGDSWRATVAIAIAALGVSIDLFCAISFWRSKTTVNPLSPRKSAALVTSGLYRFSRNPMYLGQALVLVGWAIFLNSAWGPIGPVAFALYLNRFQIVPEELVLGDIFGETYAKYLESTRRWI